MSAVGSKADRRAVPDPVVVPSALEPVAYSQTNMDFWIITGTLVFLTLTCAGVSLVLCRNRVVNTTYL